MRFITPAMRAAGLEDPQTAAMLKLMDFDKQLRDRIDHHLRLDLHALQLEALFFLKPEDADTAKAYIEGNFSVTLEEDLQPHWHIKQTHTSFATEKVEETGYSGLYNLILTAA